ncbi:MAG TPA: hydrogenase expression/formation protein HypE, partial [Thermofilum sp.]|nr:hydrogenase expression/formation protein HypE [Thermofilum sp.]
MKGRILLSHGAGGKETGELLNALILSRIWENLKRVEGGYGIDVLDDGATIPLG